MTIHRSGGSLYVERTRLLELLVRTSILPRVAPYAEVPLISNMQYELKLQYSHASHLDPVGATELL